MKIVIAFHFFKKLFKKRRYDVSLLVYLRFVIYLFIYKIIFVINGRKTKNKSCIIIFPPSLGLGDLIILSRIVDIVKASKKYNQLKVASFAPYLQKTNQDSLLTFNNLREIVSFEEYIFPTPSLLNLIISFIIGRKKCKGYIYKNYVNFNSKNIYKIKFDDPYYLRLKPFKELFKYKKSIKPFVWSASDREKIKSNNYFFSINNYLNKKIKSNKEQFIVISTYNFFKKFRPPLGSILKEIKKIEKNHNYIYIVILGANSKDEIIYNSYLENNLKDKINCNIINFTGRLSIKNSLEIITQSSYYIGANNGLANVAQMVGIKCTLLFIGPEKARKRKFSKYSNIIELK